MQLSLPKLNHLKPKLNHLKNINQNIWTCYNNENYQNANHHNEMHVESRWFSFPNSSIPITTTSMIVLSSKLTKTNSCLAFSIQFIYLRRQKSSMLILLWWLTDGLLWIEIDKEKNTNPQKCADPKMWVVHSTSYLLMICVHTILLRERLNCLQIYYIIKKLFNM